MTDKIVLKNVRLSFPELFRPKTFSGGDDDDKGEPKYSASFLLDPEDRDHRRHIRDIEGMMRKVAEEKWGKGKIPRSVKYCLHDGNEKDYDGYEEMMFVSSSNSRRPIVCHRDKSPIYEEDDIVYAGCYVNASISFWAQDNKFGKRINANLRGVQFVKDGEPFGEGPLDAEEEFGDDDDYDDDEPPRRSRGRGRGRSEPEEEEYEDEPPRRSRGRGRGRSEPDEEEYEDEPPRRSRGRGRGRSEPDEEEYEDEPPRRSRGNVRKSRRVIDDDDITD